MPTFRTKYQVGARPAHLPTGMVMVAPRPLYGEQVKIHPEWGWVGQVVIDPTNGDHLARNHALDAAVVVWVAKADIVAAERQHLTAEYGEGAVDDAKLDDDELALSWLTRHVDDQREVTA